MDTSGFIITSFLLAKNDPSLILKSIKQMHEIGMACVAFKRVIYEELPAEVIAFADKNDFPVITMDNDLWFENVIFDIMYAVQFDDKVYLSEEKIDAMLSGAMNRSELDIILKGFHSKGLMVRYGDGLFHIMTSTRDDHKSHDLIRREAFESLGIAEGVSMGMSDVHENTALDRAFRESRQCWLASAAVGRSFDHFGQIGICRVLLPAVGNEEAPAFAKDILDAFADKNDLHETASEYVGSGGDIAKAAAALHCHQNTIRYRLGKIRELTGLQEVTDSELYLQLKTALIIDRARRMIL